MIKDLMRVHYNAATRGFGYFCNIHFKIMTHNIMPEPIRVLGISYKYTLKKVKHHF